MGDKSRVLSDNTPSINLIGGDVAVFDNNNDGWEDIYLTVGLAREHLYKNNGDGSFTEIGVTAGIGFTQNIVTMGVRIGDLDKDGWRDILDYNSGGGALNILMKQS